MTGALGGDKAERTLRCGTGFPVAAIRRRYLRRSKTTNDKATLHGCCKSGHAQSDACHQSLNCQGIGNANGKHAVWQSRSYKLSHQIRK